MVAVVGVACRLPQAPDPASFWQLLRTGTNAVTEVPADRWYPEPGPDSPAPATPNTRYGAFLDRIDLFDPDFFGISPAEAVEMDPQQRLMLELTWEAFEDAGIVPATLAGSRTGVFLGVMCNDYATLLLQHGPQAIGRHSMTGLHRSIIANRASFSLALRGPSLTVDAGQSSSAVAVHLACESLRHGECTLAVAGGVNLNIIAESTVCVERFGGLSPDGRCFTFDARANGYVRGEGGAAVVLKPLSRAIADGDTVYCVILGSAVNNDGASRALTVPDRRGQEEVLRLACQRAAVDPAAIQYVELHGTGTRVGDPVEAAALGAVFGAARRPDSPLLVGSVKTNIGHLEGAAGIAALLKVAMCIRHREIPPSLNFETPNPLIPFDELNLRVQGALGPWPRQADPLLAGVSAFGMGGTNCHLVLAEPPPGDDPPGAGGKPTVRRTGRARQATAWPVSARSQAALRGQAKRLHDFVIAERELATDDVGFSLSTTRSTFEHRAVIVSRNRTGFRRALKSLVRGEPAAGLVQAVASNPGKTVFVFPGQGSQWAGMALELLDSSEVFREEVRRCADALAAHTGWSVMDVLREAPRAPSIDRTEVVQPVLFAVMTALAALWRSIGVNPDAVIGHSQGEIAAAYVAGGLSLPDAARVVALRSRTVAALAGTGGMASIALAADRTAERLVRWADLLGIAAVNGPASTVVAGDPTALDELLAECEADDIRARRIPVDYASHSPHVEAIREKLVGSLAGIEPRASDVAFYSTVTGGLLSTAHLDAYYWYRNLRQPVHFERATRALLDQGHRVFIEASPHPVLTTTVQDTIDTGQVPEAGVVVGSLRRDDGGWERFLLSAAQVHVHGAAVAWRTVTAERGARLVRLPTYSFQRQRYWLDGPAAATRRTGPTVPQAPEPSAPEPSAPAGGTDDALNARLARLAEPAQLQALLRLLRANIAVTLGHATAGTVDISRSFRDLGFDSLAGVELRNRLAAATGLRLPATVTFDYPTPAALAQHLRTRLVDVPAEPAAPGPTAVSGGEPVAVIGVGCRYPGGVRSPEDLWDLVLAGRDVISRFPTDRGWPDWGPEVAEGFARSGGFVADAAGFDAGFFGISPREALAMDPQQRVLLETGWEAIERAGIDPTTLRGTMTGVFAGVIPQDYGPRMHEAASDLQGYLMTGSTTSIASGRLAYTFGLHGPALTVDTACSSSLVAIHLACQALQRGECVLALAGGATIMATPGIFTEFHRQHGLAPDGRCKPFAAAANGTGWAEGAGLLVLERLSDAHHNGHRVLAVIRGSAVNQDGASNGLTAPNGSAQHRVIRQALANAQLTPADIDAVEAHGTGTVLGDPIEAQALITAYAPRPHHQPLYVASVKSNIGHTQAAAGVAGVIKMIMAMRHGILPKTLHIDIPSRHVDWTTNTLSLLTEPAPWPTTGHPRRAAVSSFGISGTNAHLIVEQPADNGGQADQAGATGDAIDTARARPAVAWPISAKTTPALRAQAQQIHDYLATHPAVTPTDVASALATRTTFTHRAVVLGHTRHDLLTALHALATNHSSDLRGGHDIGQLIQGIPAPGKTAFLFPGQGSQRPGMGRELHTAYPAFAHALDEACAYLDAHLRTHRGPHHTPLRDVMFADADTPHAALLHQTAYTQAALFAYQTALYRLVEAFGRTPDYLLGHSVGEITAAHIAGILTLPDACTLVAARGHLMQTLPAIGAMIAITATETELQPLIEYHSRKGATVTIAALNSPSSTVISGDLDATQAIAEHFSHRGRNSVPLNVGHAFHSPHMDPILHTFHTIAETLTYHPPTIPIVTNLTGRTATHQQLETPTYWTDHIRRPVRYSDAVRHLHTNNTTTYLELTPHPTLTPLTIHSLPATTPPALVTATTQQHTHDEPSDFLTALAHLHSSTTAPTTWPTNPNHHHPNLPTYPFQHHHYWLPTPTPVTPTPVNLTPVTPTPVTPTPTPADHPLTGTTITLADPSRRWFTHALAATTPWFVAQHQLLGTPVLPAAAMIEWALGAARMGTPDQPTVWTLTGVGFHELMRFPDERPINVQALVEGDRETSRVRCFGQAAGDAGRWTEHVTVTTAVPSAPAGPDPVDLDGLLARTAEQDIEEVYRRLERLGLQYGPAVRGLRRLWRHLDEAVGLVEVPAAASDGASYVLHPAVLDACFQMAATFFDDGADTLRLPVALDHIAVYGRLPERVWCQMRWRGTRDGGDCAVDLVVLSETGHRLVAIDGLRLRPVARPYTLFTHLVPDGDTEAQPVRRDSPDLAGLVLRDVTAAREAVLAELLDQLALLLRLTAADREALRPTFRHTRLNTLGLDSLTTLQLRDRLLADLSAEVPPDLLLGGDTAEEVAELICQQLAARSVIATDDGEPVAGAATEVLTL